MSFLEDVAAANVRRLPQCTVGVWRAEFEKTNPAEVVEFDAALADQTVTNSAIHSAMRKRGYQYGSSAVGRHRKGACSCHSRVMS